MRQSGYLIVEGNIGAGKSTFAKALTRAFHDLGLAAEYLPEPDEQTNPFLQRYYSNSKRWAFTMQCHLLGKRFEATQYAQHGAQAGRGWFIMDRSYFGDLCFANVQRRDGYFDDDEFKSYVTLHHAMQTFIHFPTAAIFLEVDPSRCLERINKRMSEKEGRKCESSISMKYLSELNDELVKLSRFMNGKAEIFRSFGWNAPKTSEGIDQIAARLVGSITEHKLSDRFDTYSPWGADGDKLFEVDGISDFKGLAQRECSI